VSPTLIWYGRFSIPSAVIDASARPDGDLNAHPLPSAAAARTMLAMAGRRPPWAQATAPGWRSLCLRTSMFASMLIISSFRAL
jgi:hypothetical protein